MIDWEKLESINAGKKTERKLLNHFKEHKKVLRGGVRKYIIEKCKNKVVLDIGALEHGFDNISKSDGMFFRIHKVAKHVTGLDIIEADVNKMKIKGYDFVFMDATSKKYLGRKYDVINVGDVIEHVDSPIALLEFCERHLNPEGEILVTTPNPYYVSTLINLFKQEEQITNFQHTCWIVPCMAHELGRRTNLEISEYVVSEPTTKSWRVLLKWLPISFKSGVFLFVYKKVKN